MYISRSGSPDDPVIVFLHGNGASGEMWKQHLAQLDGFYCLAPDFPGYGRSNHLEWVSLEDTADKIAALIREASVRGIAHIVGLSLGGSTALTLLERHPHLLDHVIVDGAGVLPLPGLPFMKIGFRLLQPFLKTEFVIKTIASSTKIPSSDYPNFRQTLRDMSASSFTRSFVQALEVTQPAGLEKVFSPTLFVAGEKEPEAVRQSGRLLASVMPSAQSMVVPGKSHGWLAEDPDLHVRMVRAWLEDKPLPSELVANKNVP